MSDLKQTIKESYQKLALIYHASESTKHMKHLIANSTEPIPELSSREKKEILSYWKQYGIHLGNTVFHRFMYAKTGIRDPRFIPTWVGYNVIYPKLNDPQLITAWDDKAYLSLRLQGLPTPTQIVANIGGYFFDESLRRISAEEAAELVHPYSQVIIKPTIDSGTGKGVTFHAQPFDCMAAFDLHKKNFTVQPVIEQSKTMCRLNPTSLNAIRIMTLQWEGKIHILCSGVNIGGSGELVDNAKSRFGFAPISLDGRIGPVALDSNCAPITTSHTGALLSELVVPNIQKVVELAKQGHLRYPHFGIIGWDIGIDSQDEPVIIESNLRSPGFFTPQLLFGPLFREHTDTILSRLFLDK